MKIEVYKESPTEEKVLRVRLFQDIDSVTLAAVDDEGDKVAAGNILEIGRGGIERYPSASPDLGLPLDYTGRVRDITP